MICPRCRFSNPDDTVFCGLCAAPLRETRPAPAAEPDLTITFDNAPAPLIGRIVAGKYRIVGELGHGGMGIVYKAEDIRLDRPVALKFLSPEIAHDAEARGRFVREARAAAALDHPHICTVHEIDDFEGETFIAMAFVEGRSLKGLLQAGRPDPAAALDIAAQIADGLAAAHAKGIVHRDIKSANVMVAGDGQVRIMDFGIAKLRGGAQVTRQGTTLGTAAYMSPEQARGEEVDPRSDLWSLGVVLYEMLTGRLPFRGDGEAAVLTAILLRNPEPLAASDLGLPAELDKIVRRALSKNPGDRYGSAFQMREDLDRARAALTPAGGGFDLRAIRHAIRKPAIAVPALLAAVALIALGIRSWRQGGGAVWARERAIPEIVRLIEADLHAPAFRLAREAESRIPRDPVLAELWPRMSREISIRTDPPGARVSMREYGDPEAVWESLGETPIEAVRIPLGYFRWRIEKPGYLAIETAHTGGGAGSGLEYRLDPVENAPPGMVRVPGGRVSGLQIINISFMEPVAIGDFWLDAREVTNAQFAEFVDAGGYRRPELWTHPFVRNGRELTWDEAVREFRDATGRPGPAGWEIGTFREGEADFPVGGVSWYEAAAYAEFAGKRLPTIQHWILAAGLDQGFRIIPLSNFSGRGPVRAGELQGLSPSGAYDMAGNVREWCWNGSGDTGFPLGGSWEDPEYLFTFPYGRSRFDRSVSNGIRCLKIIDEASWPEAAAAPLPDSSNNRRDYDREQPVSTEVFRAHSAIFSYERSGLDPRAESRDESPPFWVEERISYAAAYGTDRVPAVLFLPKGAAPPYQTVIYFPGSSSLNLRSSDGQFAPAVDFMVKSGRAVLCPVYKSMYERADGYRWPPESITAFRDQMVCWFKDLARSVDYLNTRGDIDPDRIAYFGSSLGGHTGVVFLAVEDRIRTGILYVAGFLLPRITAEAPEIDQLNFAPRVTMPVLMLNGRYDFIFPLETSQLPLFRRLGTPPEHKDHKVYEAAHFVPRTELIKETLDWLDRYLGPVR